MSQSLFCSLKCARPSDEAGVVDMPSLFSFPPLCFSQLPTLPPTSHLINMQASCQCGLVRFETPAAQAKIFICHCTDCRHQSSSAFGISAMFSRPSFEKVVMPVLQKKIQAGDVKIYESPTDSGRIKQCLFCSRCGSRLAHPGKGEEEKEGAMVR